MVIMYEDFFRKIERQIKKQKKYLPSPPHPTTPHPTPKSIPSHNNEHFVYKYLVMYITNVTCMLVSSLYACMYISFFINECLHIYMYSEKLENRK